jgi:hypothetical protein
MAVEVECWGNIDGVWGKIGDALYQNRDAASSTALPTFTFDISGILKNVLSKNFHKDILNKDADDPIELDNHSSNPYYTGMTSIRTVARSWYEVDGILEKVDLGADTVLNPASGVYINPTDIAISDNAPSISYYDNLPISTDYSMSWLFDGSTTTSSISKKSFMTNCPPLLRRKVSMNHPLILGVMMESLDLGNAKIVLTYDEGSGIATSDIDTYGLMGTGIRPVIWNLTPKESNSSGLFSGGSDYTQLIPEFDIHLEIIVGSHQTPPLRFELLSNDVTKCSNIKQNTSTLYWINDYGCLDFFHFNGGDTLDSETERTTYIKGRKDWTDNYSSRLGIAEGKTIFKRTCHSEALNKEAISWLTEILRSTQVYRYDLPRRQLLPVTVIEGVANPLSFDRQQGQMVVTIVDDILIQKD